MGVEYVNVHVLRHLKAELGWTIDKRLWLIINTMLSSSSDLQPSTAVANQLPGQLVNTQITTRGPNCFKCIIALLIQQKHSLNKRVTV